MANRKGAGGPKTPDGKQSSSQNAVKHFCCSTKRLVPGETAEEFERFYKTWIERHNPTNPYDGMLVRAAVDAAWRQKRSERALGDCEAKLYAEQPDATLWSAEQHKQLQTFRRYYTADTNALHKAIRLLDTVKRSERQTYVAIDRIAEMEINNFLQPENRREAKNKACALINRPYTLPTNRQDGGCTCPPCLLEWGMEEWDRVDLEKKLKKGKPDSTAG